MLKVNGEIKRSDVVESVVRSVYSKLVYHDPPDMTFPSEQSTILMELSIIFVAGVFPIAVTTNLKLKSASAVLVNLTLFTSLMLAPYPSIE